MVAGFHSHYWRHRELTGASARALAELMAPTEPRAYLAAFRTLLHSDDTVAAGIALDHFQYAEALTRFGRESALDQLAPEVLAVARELLRQPPLPAEGDVGAGANHASALLAMMNLAGPADADLIAAALERATTGDVRQAACRAAGNALHGAEPSRRLIATLGAVAFDERLDVAERTQALSALSEADAPEATELLLRATESTELAVQLVAADGLTRGNRLAEHRDLLVRLAASWPDGDGDGTAWQVRDIRRRLGLPG